MTEIGFIGLGIMGAPMAANLVKAGHTVRGFNRSVPAREQLTKVGGHAAVSIAEAVTDAEVIITMLPDGPDVRAVCLGEGGAFASSTSGALHIDMSSISPDVAVELNNEAKRRGLGAIDAPVSGGEAGAIEAQLSIMVGGEVDDYERALPILNALGSTVVHVGPPGSGQTVKAANQLIVAGTIELVAEALVLLEAYGVETAPAVHVLAGGLAGSRVLDRKADAMMRRDFKPGFRVDLHHKDLGIVMAAAREKGVAIPLGTLCASLMGSLRAQGGGDLDHSALLQLVTQLSGRSDSLPATPPA